MTLSLDSVNDDDAKAMANQPPGGRLSISFIFCSSQQILIQASEKDLNNLSKVTQEPVEESGLKPGSADSIPTIFLESSHMYYLTLSSSVP